MQIHEITRKNKRAVSRQIGRGGSRGKTSGKGMKGQKARAGRKIRPHVRDMIKKLPKKRGYKAPKSNKMVYWPVNLSQLNKFFSDGAKVNPESLFRVGLIKKQSGRYPAIKILGRGELKTKLTVEGCVVSGAAKEAIEKAQGQVLI